MRPIVTFVTLVLLAGCTATQTGSAVSAVQQACISVQPVVAAANASTNAKAQQVAAYATAVCGPVMAGTIPATVDASTPVWLGSVAGILQALLPVAVGLL